MHRFPQRIHFSFDSKVYREIWTDHLVNSLGVYCWLCYTVARRDGEESYLLLVAQAADHLALSVQYLAV